MKLNVLILDDEKENLDHLSYWLNKYCGDYIEKINVSTNIPDAVSLINETKPELLFLDVELAHGVKSFDLLDLIPRWEGKIIFVTAHQNYAIEAIKVKAFDYLLKPISITELIDAVENALDSFKINSSDFFINTNVGSTALNELDFLAIGHQSEIQIIKKAEIVCLKSSGNYTEIYIENGDLSLSSKIIKVYEIMLTDITFVRVHHSYIINLKFLEKIVKEGSWTCIMKNGMAIPVSRRKKDILNEILKII